MPFIIFEGTAPQRSEVQRLKQNLVKALDDVRTLNRQLDEMTDAQAATQFGVPLAVAPVFRTNIDDLLTALQTTAVTNIISSVGFTL